MSKHLYIAALLTIFTQTHASNDALDTFNSLYSHIENQISNATLRLHTLENSRANTPKNKGNEGIIPLKNTLCELTSNKATPEAGYLCVAGKITTTYESKELYTNFKVTKKATYNSYQDTVDLAYAVKNERIAARNWMVEKNVPLHVREAILNEQSN